MKYIRALEAAGFGRDQAEAQVQVVLDAVEGELVTKSDFALFQERLDHRFLRIDQRFVEMEQRFDQRFIEMAFKLVTRLGFLTVSSVSIAVAVLTWLIKT